MTKKLIIFYDSIQSPLQTKRELLGTLAKDCKIFNLGSVRLCDGRRVRLIEDTILEYQGKGYDITGLIWNGTEIGCGMMRRIFIKHNVKFAYAEQGIMPQNENLRFMAKCMHWSTAQSSFLKGVGDVYSKPKMLSTVVNVICQLPYDSSMSRLVDPINDFQNEVLEFLEHHSDPSKIDIVVCKHPKALIEDYLNFEELIPKVKSFRYKSTSTPTAEQCEGLDLVLGWNSTVLLELAANGRNCFALDADSYTSIVNHEDSKTIKEMVENYQFSPRATEAGEILSTLSKYTG